MNGAEVVLAIVRTDLKEFFFGWMRLISGLYPRSDIVVVETIYL